MGMDGTFVVVAWPDTKKLTALSFLLRRVVYGWCIDDIASFGQEINENILMKWFLVATSFAPTPGCRETQGRGSS